MMAWATGPGDFRAKIKTHCSHLSLELIRISGAKPFAGDRHNNGLDANLISAAGGVAKKMNAWHGTFHSYSKKMKSTKVSKHAGKPR